MRNLIIVKKARCEISRLWLEMTKQERHIANQIHSKQKKRLGQDRVLIPNFPDEKFSRNAKFSIQKDTSSGDYYVVFYDQLERIKLD